MAEDDLLSALDKAAAHLVDLARATVDAEGKPVPHTLAEQVKAFDAAVRYLEIRNELAPKTPQKAAFDGIRDAFNGSAQGRRRSRAKKAEPAFEPDAESGAGSVFDA